MDNVPDFIVSDILDNTLKIQEELDEKRGNERLKNLCICMEMAARLWKRIDRALYAEKIKDRFFGEDYEVDILEKINKKHDQLFGKEGCKSE